MVGFKIFLRLITQHRVVSYMKKERISFRTFSFFLESRPPFSEFNLRGYFFNEIVLIASCLKAHFEVGDIVIEHEGTQMKSTVSTTSPGLET